MTLKTYMGSQFITSLANDSKLATVQIDLFQEGKEITFQAAKAAVVKA